ncbi:complement factor B [Salminus brasiliensis]|uniref:complement factor B n=1 Tax=Salminus brasiliensis TaxID=930266 RepID=UPI003B82EDAB
MQFTAAYLLSVALCFSIAKVHTEDYHDYDYSEGSNTVKSCNMTESIRGGTVGYSKEGAVGSKVTYHCEDGFEPYPVSEKVCNTKGTWEPKTSRMKCEEKMDYGDYEEPQKNCSLEEAIRNGTVSYSNGGLEGSVLTYHCRVGHYPYPIRRRVCNSKGEWSAMVLPNGKRVSSATCKKILCPAQLQLDQGEFWPKKQWFEEGEGQTFSCKEGYALHGSAQRNCTKWGQWTGTTPVCDDQTDDCRNPGTPPGAIRSGDRFRIGDKVTYRCQSGLDLLGPNVRECLHVREWSRPEPRCQAQYTFDLPATVAKAMGGSLSAVMEVSSPELRKKDPGFGRAMKVAEGRLNIFILLDTSGSILEEEFMKAKEATVNLIRKLGSYDVDMKFDIISYASEPKDIITIMDPRSSSVEFVVGKLLKFSHTGHGQKTGTNLYKALYSVYERLSWLKAQRDSHFNETQNVILIETDGHSNMGGDPKQVLGLIRGLLGYRSYTVDHTAEELLDVYVFGIGENVKRDELTGIASSKIREQHLFVLSTYTDLGEVFNSMINDTAVTKCGVAKELVYSSGEVDFAQPQDANTRPWHVTLTWKTKPCQGAILSENWVITAAHCLIKLEDGVLDIADPKDINIRHGNGRSVASLQIPHPQFNVKGLKDKNVNEFYDYDVALIKVSSKIKLSSKARPICLPCTKASNRALKLSPDTTCKKHESYLINLKETQAHFISQGKHRKQTHIQAHDKRKNCIEQYGPALSSNKLVTLTDVITDRFLCTGGSEAHKDEITCKGDSGGALFLRKGMRYFQVGIVSWGTKCVCDSTTKLIPDPPEDARDFHINVFSIIPWLKEHLNKDMDFLPM